MHYNVKVKQISSRHGPVSYWLLSKGRLTEISWFPTRVEYVQDYRSNQKFEDVGGVYRAQPDPYAEDDDDWQRAYTDNYLALPLYYWISS